MRFVPLVLLLAMAACAPSAKLTESEEYYAGRAVSADILVDCKLYHNQGVQEYVNLVGWTVALACDRPEVFNGWTFGVVVSDKVNAVSAPSGFIFITTSMLKLIQNEDELAGVLAHEIGHVCRRHPELAVAAQMKAQGGYKVLAGAIKIGAAIFDKVTGGEKTKEIAEAANLLDKVSKHVCTQLWEKGYERDQEYEADLLALDYVSHPDAGYNPQAFIDVLKRVGEQGKKKLGGFFNPSTHPDPGQRVGAAAQYMNAKGYRGETNAARTERFLKITASLR
ncbi:MAG: M48 family metalloprotease [Planctomycetota bacterium]|jgi:predicted Zn-dependent protease